MCFQKKMGNSLNCLPIIGYFTHHQPSNFYNYFILKFLIYPDNSINYNNKSVLTGKPTEDNWRDKIKLKFVATDGFFSAEDFLII